MAISFQNFTFISQNFAQGGINLKSAVTALADNESPELKNIILTQNGAVQKRKGFSKLNPIQIPGPFPTTGIYQLQQSTGNNCTIIGNGDSLYEDAVSPIVFKTGQTPGALYDFSALNDFAFIVNGVDANLKYNCNNVFGLGIDSPVSAPTDGGALAGANLTILAPGDTYGWAYTFVNAEGFESNPSSVFTLVGPTVAGLQDRKINIAISTDPQVVSRNIYRTFPNGQVFLFAGSVADNVTTFFDDHTPDNQLGDEVEFDNDKPPILKYIETHKNRLFGVEAANPNRVRFSKEFNQDAWPLLNFFDVSPDDGDIITSLISFFDQMPIFKRESIYILSGNNETDFIVQRAQSDSRIGAVSTRTVKVLNNEVAFLSERGAYIFDGLRTKYISPQLEAIFDRSNTNQYRRFNWAQEGIACAENYKYGSKNWYWLNIPIGSDSSNGLCLIYDYTASNWVIFDGIYAHSIAIVEEQGAPRLYTGDYNGFLWKQDESFNDGYAHQVSFSTSNANGASTLEDLTQTWAVDILKGVRVKIVSGLGSGQIRTIISNTVSVFTIMGAWDIIPNATSKYSIGFIEGEWESRWFNYNSPDLVKRLMYAHVNAEREGDYDLIVGLRFDFATTDQNTVFRLINLGGSGSIWDVSLWDTATWDDIITTVTRLTNDPSRIHRYVQFLFRNDIGLQPFTVNSMNLVYQLKGIRH